jgi:ABC-type multidrug transport system ATPase subunit
MSVDLQWVGLGLATKDGKAILENVSGYSRGGSITAVMGPSGSGKTSLLNAISKRTDSGQLLESGSIRACGQDYGKAEFSRFGAYLSQNDILLESLTVE